MWRGRAKPSLCCNVNCRTIWASTSRTHIAVSGVKTWGHVCPSFGSIYHHVPLVMDWENVLVIKHFMWADYNGRLFKVLFSVLMVVMIGEKIMLNYLTLHYFPRIVAFWPVSGDGLCDNHIIIQVDLDYIYVYSRERRIRCKLKNTKDTQGGCICWP